MAAWVVQNILKESDIFNNWPPFGDPLTCFQEKTKEVCSVIFDVLYIELLKELGKIQKGNTSLKLLKSENFAENY